MNINHISVSRKKTFDQCQQKYKFQYHLKLPPVGPEPFYFTYGTLVHKVAETYVEEGGKRSTEEIAKDIFSNKIHFRDKEKCPALPADYAKKFKKHIKAVETLLSKIGTEGSRTEFEFRFDLDPPHKREVTGFIDLLIIRNGKAYIIDYKTTKKGKWRTNKENVTSDLQLKTYARVVQKEYGIAAENIKAGLFFLEGEELVIAQFSDQTLLDVEAELKEAFIRIESADPDKVWGNVGWHCKTCDFCQVCPFYQSKGGDVPQWSGDPLELGHDNQWA